MLYINYRRRGVWLLVLCLSSLVSLLRGTVIGSYLLYINYRRRGVWLLVLCLYSSVSLLRVTVIWSVDYDSCSYSFAFSLTHLPSLAALRFRTLIYLHMIYSSISLLSICIISNFKIGHFKFVRVVQLYSEISSQKLPNMLRCDIV